MQIKSEKTKGVGQVPCN